MECHFPFYFWEIKNSVYQHFLKTQIPKLYKNCTAGLTSIMYQNCYLSKSWQITTYNYFFFFFFPPQLHSNILYASCMSIVSWKKKYIIQYIIFHMWVHYFDFNDICLMKTFHSVKDIWVNLTTWARYF